MSSSLKRLSMLRRAVVLLGLVGSACLLAPKIFSMYQGSQIGTGAIIYTAYTCWFWENGCLTVPEGAGDWDIYVTASNGTTIALSIKDVSNECPSVSPNGSQIAFISETEWPAGDLYVANVDGSGTTRIASKASSEGGCPSWSPDSSQIAFVLYRGFPGNNNVDNTICVVGREGGDPDCLDTTGPTGWNPGWAPDGQSIAFLSAPDTGIDALLGGFSKDGLYVMELVSKDRRRLSEDRPVSGSHGLHEPILFGPSRTFLSRRFSWSPDSQKIAFYTDDSGGIYVVNADGSNLIHIADSDVTYQASAPSWSPDSQYIAFDVFLRDDLNLDNIPDIYIAKADGSNLIRLTNDRMRGLMPQWSPDGSLLAFLSVRLDVTDATSAIYVTKPDGSGMRLVARGKNFAWSPNGQSLAFISDDNDDIYVVSIDNLRAKRVTYTGGEKALVAWLP